MRKYILICFYILITNLLVAQEILSKSDSSITTCAWSNNGKYFATSWNNSIIIWNAANNTIKAICSGHQAPVISIVFSKTNNYFLTIAEDNSIIIRSLENLFRVEVFENESSYITKDADFSDKGYSIVFPVENYEITSFYRLILTNQIIKKKFAGHTDLIYSLDINNSENLMLSSSNDGTTKLWNLVDFSYVNSFPIYYESKIPSVFNSDGTLFLYPINENSIGISGIDGKTIKIITSHHRLINSAEFSSDSKYIAVATDNGGVEVYDILTGELYGKCRSIIENGIEQEIGIVNDLCFDPTGDFILAVTSLGYTIRGSLSGKVLVPITQQYIDENLLEFAKQFEDSDLEFTKEIKKVGTKQIEEKNKDLEEKENLEDSNNENHEFEEVVDTKENTQEDLTKYNMIPIQIGYSTLQSDFFLGNIDIDIEYLYKEFKPLFLGISFTSQMGLPNKEFPYVYKVENESLSSPFIYSFGLGFCLGLEYKIPNTRMYYFMLLNLSINTRFLWNNSFTHPIIGQFILGFNTGLSIGFDIYGIRISSMISYDTNYELSIQGKIGYAFSF